MQDFLELALRILNGMITIGFFPFLFQIYRKTSRRFYLLWSLGFLLYGLNIIIRGIFLFTDFGMPTMGSLFAFIFLISGFILLLTGVGDLVNRARTALIFSMILPLLVIIIFFATGPENLGRAISLSPYLFISTGLLVIRRRYAATLDLLIVGWLILLLVNIGQPLGLISSSFVEMMAVFGKVIIFYGMVSPKFSFLVDDLKRYLISGTPEVYNNENHLGLTLINSGEVDRNTEIQWIIKKIGENSPKAVRTVVVTIYDTISPRDLRAAGLDDDFFLVRVLAGGTGHLRTFEEQIMTLSDDPNELELLFSDIMGFSNDKKIRCEIILYSLSILIHTHGWKRIYTFLLSKMSQLKVSNVAIYAFYYPKTHSEDADIAKFEKLADRVIAI